MMTNYSLLFCQDKPVVDLSFVSQENIEYTALKPLFFLIRQEYVIIARNGEKITRGGNEYFGKAYTIGVISKSQKLWFPEFIRSPWNEDENFNAYKEQYKPECTNTRVRALNDSAYKFFTLTNLESHGPIVNFRFGLTGIKISDTISESGCLIIFHSKDQIPEKKENIQYSIVNIEGAKWNSEGSYAIAEPYLGSNQQIIGGAYFKRIITRAKIEWELAGLYVKMKDIWVIQSLILQE